MPESTNNSGRQVEGGGGGEGQGIVTYVSPVEAFATGIKFLIDKKCA